MTDSAGHVLIRGGRLLDATSHEAKPTDILIEGNTILELGPPGLAAPEGARVIDAADRMLIPGLVNAHTHGHGSLAKGTNDRWSLELLLNSAPWTSGHRTLEDKRVAAMLNAADLVRKGCTACYDLYFEFPVPTVEGLEAVAQGYGEVGVRALVAPMMADRLFYEAIPGLMEAIPDALRGRVETVRAAPFAESLAALRKVLPEGRGDRAMFDLGLAPTIPLHCSDDFMTACRDLAEEYDTRVHMHLAESKVQAVVAPRAYDGKTLTAHLDALGLLGPRFTGAHCIWLDADDIGRMADNGICVAHNPGSNLRLGSGVAPARALLDAGVNLGVGTDGSQCSDNQNLFEAMRLAAFVSRIGNPDVETWIGAEDAFRMATEGGARLLGQEGVLGRVAPGYRADIVFLDLTHVNYIPLNDPLYHVVFCEDGSAVDSVMVDGRMVLEHGRFTTFDEAALRRDAQAAVERLREANAESRIFSQALEAHVAMYCVGLANQAYPVDRKLAGQV